MYLNPERRRFEIVFQVAPPGDGLWAREGSDCKVIRHKEDPHPGDT
jgi:hypothetical protein